MRKFLLIALALQWRSSRGGASQPASVPCWVRAVPIADGYEALEWGGEPFGECRRLDADAHYRTQYPMAPLPGPGGEGGAVVVLRDGR